MTSIDDVLYDACGPNHYAEASRLIRPQVENVERVSAALATEELGAAAHALCEALPRCRAAGCEAAATRTTSVRPDGTPGYWTYCDVHGEPDDDMRYAPPLRALVALLDPPAVTFAEPTPPSGTIDLWMPGRVPPHAPDARIDVVPGESAEALARRVAAALRDASVRPSAPVDLAFSAEGNDVHVTVTGKARR
jgi:hypothetical protein